MNPTVMIYSSGCRPILAVSSEGLSPLTEGHTLPSEPAELLRSVLREWTKLFRGLVVPCNEIIVAVGQHFLNVRARHALALARAAVVCQQENRGCALDVHCRPHFDSQRL